MFLNNSCINVLHSLCTCTRAYVSVCMFPGRDQLEKMLKPDKYKRRMLAFVGSRYQEDMRDDNLSSLIKIYGIFVRDGYMYVAHDVGLGRFPIVYEEGTPSGSPTDSLVP